MTDARTLILTSLISRFGRRRPTLALLMVFTFLNLFGLQECLVICFDARNKTKILTSGLGLDDMSLAWPAVAQLLVFIYSGIQ